MLFLRRYRRLGISSIYSNIDTVTDLSTFTIDDIGIADTNYTFYITNDSGLDKKEILAINGNEITLKEPLSITPVNGDKVYLSSSSQLLFIGLGAYELGGEIEEEVIKQY